MFKDLKELMGDYKWLCYIIIGVFVLILLFNSIGIIDETERGVRVTMGKAHEDITQPGVYTKLPFITKMVKYSVKVIKEDRKMASYTRDIQTADLEISVSYQLERDDLVTVYARYGRDWEEKIVWNNLQQAVKDTIGRYEAEHLVENRGIVASSIFQQLNERIADLPANVTQFQLLNIDFSKEFERAVESKVIAVQQAREAENKTVRIAEEARQKVLTAQAEAESMRIRSQALAQNRGLVDYEIAIRWNGVLPTTVLGNTIPMLNLGNIGSR
jgi:regulator of protease activity HflC (stomatin/prohibitin superfamily)